MSPWLRNKGNLSPGGGGWGGGTPIYHSLDGGVPLGS